MPAPWKYEEWQYALMRAGAKVSQIRDRAKRSRDLVTLEDCTLAELEINHAWKLMRQKNDPPLQKSVAAGRIVEI